MRGIRDLAETLGFMTVLSMLLSLLVPPAK